MYEAVIVAECFEGKGTLARHRMVNAALKEEIAGVHAWTQKCLSGKEWEKKKAEEAAAAAQ
jgi:stress-induced morphogen